MLLQKLMNVQCLTKLTTAEEFSFVGFQIFAKVKVVVCRLHFGNLTPKVHRTKFIKAPELKKYVSAVNLGAPLAEMKQV